MSDQKQHQQRITYTNGLERNISDIVSKLDDVMKDYDAIYLITGYSAAEFESFDDVLKDIDIFFQVDSKVQTSTEQSKVLLLYGGDPSVGNGKRTLGDLIRLLKFTYSQCYVMAVVCDRDTYEDFIDCVIIVDPMYDTNRNIVYGGYNSLSVDSSTLTLPATEKNQFRLVGNTVYYLHESIQKYITRVIICGGGLITLQETQYVVDHTSIPYSFISASSPRHPESYGYTKGPVHAWFENKQISLHRNK